jgi:ribosome-binding protein 1
MDVPALLVFVGGFAVCAGVVFLISIFGAKEETFEEALAKQRKANEKEKNKGKDKKKDVDKKVKNWRNKKKGDKEEKLDNMDDGEEEALVIVPAVETSPEPTPQPTPEPKQAKKEKKKEKKKIEIQEVEEIVAVEEVVEASVVAEEVPVVEKVELTAASPVAAIEEEIEQVTEPVKVAKPSPTKQKAKKEKNVPTEAAPGNPKDLLAIVKKTAFNDVEAQKLIDVLLTKQSGDPHNTSEEWIEKGKPTESQKLRQELNETIQALEEERIKGKSFSDKMTNLRRELNEEKSAKANHNRIIEELTAARAQDVNNINNKLQQLINENSLLKGQLSQEVSHRRNIELSQTHYQATIDSLNQQLEMARAAAATASANDPHVLSELEQLRTLRDKYENTLAELSNNNSNLKSQLTQQTEEVGSVKQQLVSTEEKVSKLSNTTASLEAALVAKSEEAQKAAVELANLKIVNEAAQTAAAIPADLEAELSSTKQKLTENEKETARLLEENERLSEQLASSVERPAADGEEAGNGEMNGHGEDVETQKQVDEDWRDKFEVLHMEHEKMLAKQKMLQIEFETEVNKYQGELEGIKSKNNDLNLSLSEAKKASSALLVRLFPTIPPNMELDKLEVLAKEALKDLQAEAEKIVAAPVVDNSEEVEKLENQVAHYKTVLAQTESMLNSLQASVESAETEWRLKLEVANKELSDVKIQNSSLAAKASALEASSAQAKQAEEMQVQLADLQQKLSGEEEEKSGLAKINQDLKQSSEVMSKEVERLAKELFEERSQKEELSNKVDNLVTTNTSLQQLVGTAQEALDKENTVVKSMQEQITTNKDEVLCNQNGPSTTEAVQ